VFSKEWASAMFRAACGRAISKSAHVVRFESVATAKDSLWLRLTRDSRQFGEHPKELCAPSGMFFVWMMRVFLLRGKFEVVMETGV
jgi:hypothetical protein